MTYSKPEIVDHGDLYELTAASGIAAFEDGAGKAIQLEVDPVLQLTVQILP